MQNNFWYSRPLPYALAGGCVLLVVAAWLTTRQFGTPRPDFADATRELDGAMNAVGDGDYDLAESHAHAALALPHSDRQGARAYSWLAAACAHRNSHPTAVKWMTEAVRLMPTDAEYRRQRASCRAAVARRARGTDAAAGAWTEVARDAAESIRLDPTKGGAWALLAEAHYHTGRSDDAAREFAEAARLDPNEKDTEGRVRADPP